MFSIWHIYFLMFLWYFYGFLCIIDYILKYLIFFPLAIIKGIFLSYVLISNCILKFFVVLVMFRFMYAFIYFYLSISQVYVLGGFACTKQKPIKLA